MKFLASFVLGLGVIPLAGATVSAAPVEKVAVCHEAGDGWKVLELPVKAADNRIKRHGDGYPDGPVPGSDGAVFDEDCMPVVPEPVPEPTGADTLVSLCDEFGGTIVPGMASVSLVGCAASPDPDVHAEFVIRWDLLCRSIDGDPSVVPGTTVSVCFT